MRYRNTFITILVTSFIGLWIITDPDLALITELSWGASLISILTMLSGGFLAVTMLHFARKGLMDYVAADFKRLLMKSVASPTGSGLAAIAVSIMTLAIAVVIFAGLTAFR